MLKIRFFWYILFEFSHPYYTSLLSNGCHPNNYFVSFRGKWFTHLGNLPQRAASTLFLPLRPRHPLALCPVLASRTAGVILPPSLETILNMSSPDIPTILQVAMVPTWVCLHHQVPSWSAVMSSQMKKFLQKSWLSWKMRRFTLIPTVWWTRVASALPPPSLWLPLETLLATLLPLASTGEGLYALLAPTLPLLFRETWRTHSTSLEVHYTQTRTPLQPWEWGSACRPRPHKKFLTCSWGTGTRIPLHHDPRLSGRLSGKTLPPPLCLWRAQSRGPAPVQSLVLVLLYLDKTQTQAGQPHLEQLTGCLQL